MKKIGFFILILCVILTSAGCSFKYISQKFEVMTYNMHPAYSSPNFSNILWSADGKYIYFTSEQSLNLKKLDYCKPPEMMSSFLDLIVPDYSSFYIGQRYGNKSIYKFYTSNVESFPDNVIVPVYTWKETNPNNGFFNENYLLDNDTICDSKKNSFNIHTFKRSHVDRLPDTFTESTLRRNCAHFTTRTMNNNGEVILISGAGAGRINVGKHDLNKVGFSWFDSSFSPDKNKLVFLLLEQYTNKYSYVETSKAELYLFDLTTRELKSVLVFDERK